MLPTDKPPLYRLIEALKTRYHRVIEVIDDALNSDNLRDRIWAVDQLIKKLALDTPKKTVSPPLDKAGLKALSDDELMTRIQVLLQSTQGDATAQPLSENADD